MACYLIINLTAVWIKLAFIDEYIRTAVDEGTAVVRVGWEFEEDKRKVWEDIMELQPVIDPETGQPAVDPNTGQPAMQEVKDWTEI